MAVQPILYIIKKVISTKAKMPRKQKKERKLKIYQVWREKLELAEKIFPPWRFDATNYLFEEILPEKLYQAQRKKNYSMMVMQQFVLPWRPKSP